MILLRYQQQMPELLLMTGQQLQEEISDITIGADDLFQLVTLKAISDGLVNRIGNNYHIIAGCKYPINPFRGYRYYSTHNLVPTT